VRTPFQRKACKAAPSGSPVALTGAVGERHLSAAAARPEPLAEIVRCVCGLRLAARRRQHDAAVAHAGNPNVWTTGTATPDGAVWLQSSGLREVALLLPHGRADGPGLFSPPHR
jgi:hypothetical protein